MKELDKINDMLVDYRNSVKNNLSDSELEEVDTYILKILDDIRPVVNVIELIETNKDNLKDMKEYLDNVIQEEQWLEKLLKTS
jgi:hypothetical protein